MTNRTLRPRGVVMVYLGLAASAALLAVPFYWMFLTSLKSPAGVAAYPPHWWPSELVWSNYVQAWRSAPFAQYYVNSVVTGLATTALQMTFAVAMAYAFAAIRFPGKRGILLAVLSTMMIPDEMKLVPNFLLLNRLHWVDTYWALIVPPAAHAFPVFVLYQHFRTLPKDILDSAHIDGAGHVRIVLQVVAPMARPVLAATALVAFLGRWNDFLWPLIVTNRTAMRTLPIGLNYLKENEGRWNILMAAAIFVIIPMIGLYVAAQKQFVEGITRGALKG